MISSLCSLWEGSPIVPCLGGHLDGRKVPLDPDWMRNRCFDTPEPSADNRVRFRDADIDWVPMMRVVRYYIHVAYERQDRDHNNNPLKMWNHFLRRYEPYFLTYYWYLATPNREPFPSHVQQSSLLAQPFLIERRWKQGSLLF